MTAGSKRGHEVQVRSARLGDLSRIFEIERGCATAPHWSEGDYLRILEGGTGLPRCLLVAAAGAEVVGFAVVSESELESIAVAEPWRGRGTGEKLGRAALEWCRERGGVEVALEVRLTSAGAIRLYERLGFTAQGRRLGYYAHPNEDALLMRRRLS